MENSQRKSLCEQTRDSDVTALGVAGVKVVDEQSERGCVIALRLPWQVFVQHTADRSFDAAVQFALPGSGDSMEKLTSFVPVLAFAPPSLQAAAVAD